MSLLKIPSFASRGLLVGQAVERCPIFARRISTESMGYVPRRALMYVPGSDQRKIQKAPTLGCDCAVLDFEDGVAGIRKAEARLNVCNALKEIDFSTIGEVAVRVNSISSGLCDDDLVALKEAEVLPPTLLLPKVDTVEETKWFASTLKKLFGKRNLEQPFRLVTYVESADGMLDLREITSRLIKMSCAHDEKEGAPYVLEGIVFGSDDYLASVGAARTSDAKELIYARQKVILNAKAFRLQAIDVVYIDYKDIEGLKAQCEEGFKMGFTGKQIIHPSQVEHVQKAFTPSDEMIDWAQELIVAFDEHEKSGTGAFTFRDKMIDMPLLLQARNIVKLNEHIGKFKT